ncbi:class I SAM-dependent methyltransferase [Haematobacter genomosp. 1]|nr:SAM-dependent methyltransferase [Haematobacter genomosp. 1]
MTPLGRRIALRIARTGPITLADYMAECLLDPQYGYYTTRDPLGRGGDFVTAPEISQMFGELLGLWLAQCWLDQGAPAPFALAELGPGRGTLMADVLRATRGVPGLHEAMRVCLMEASPTLRAAQAAALAGYDPQWHDSVATLPELPLFLLANEFLDALPIRQFHRHAAGWQEVMVTEEDGRLAFALSPPIHVSLLADRIADTRPGDIVELCPALRTVVGEVGARLYRHGGAALFVDYGGWHSRGDTLQAVRNHGFTDPLAEPGLADLTAHVDFEAVARAAPPARATGMVEQGAFLERLGLHARARQLAQGMSGDALLIHRAATERLTAADAMGTVFKALALYPQTAPLPPGFAA